MICPYEVCTGSPVGIAGAVAVSETVDSPVEMAISVGVLVVLVLRDVNPLLLMGIAAAVGAATFS